MGAYECFPHLIFARLTNSEASKKCCLQNASDILLVLDPTIAVDDDSMEIVAA